MGEKIAIVGAGFVGSSTAFALMIGGLASELVLVDINRKKAEGEAMDLSHGVSFVRPVDVYAGDYADCQGARIVVFTAGANQKPGETRIDLVSRNVAVLKEALPPLLKACPDAIFLMVTNPVDILTHIALKLTGLPPERVIGSGTVLDSSRFRQALQVHYGIDARNIHGYIVGEHGDTEVPLWSLANIAGADLERLGDLSRPAPDREGIFRQVRDAAYEVIERKGATYYAVALAIRRICEAILRDENSILTVSGLMDGQYGIRDVSLSIPAVINRQGRARVVELPISPGEKEALRRSADALKGILRQVGF